MSGIAFKNNRQNLTKFNMRARKEYWEISEIFQEGKKQMKVMKKRWKNIRKLEDQLKRSTAQLTGVLDKRRAKQWEKLTRENIRLRKRRDSSWLAGAVFSLWPHTAEKRQQRLIASWEPHPHDLIQPKHHLQIPSNRVSELQHTTFGVIQTIQSITHGKGRKTWMLMPASCPW